MLAELDKYNGVIKMVFEANAGNTPEQFFEELKQSIRIAEVLVASAMNPTPATSRPTLVSAPKKLIAVGAVRSNLPKLDTKKAILISAAAPPVAGIEDTADDTPEDDADYWETKPGKQDGCNRLETYLKKTLPANITVKVPGVENPLELIRGVGGPGLKFVYVSYTLAGDPQGPRYTCMTSMKPDSDEVKAQTIIDDVIAQAAAVYSGEKRTIQPHVTEKPFTPTNSDLQAILDRDRKAQNPDNPFHGLDQDEAKKAQDDANYLRSQRSAQFQ